MRRFTTPRRPDHMRRRRGGTTLTEVLMSLLIMGIGLSSVATLFPLSVLRSIEATQQTTATALRYAAESLIDSSGTSPVYDPAGIPLLNPRPPAGAVATTLRGCPTAAIALDPDGDHDSVANDTNYDSTTHSYGYVGTDHREGFYVVDPLGYWRLRQQAESHAAARHFGDWSGVGGPPTVGSMTQNINRFSLNVPNHGVSPYGDPATDPSYFLRPLFGFTGTPESFTDSSPSTHIDENAKRAELAVGLPDSFITVVDGRMSEGAVSVDRTSASDHFVDFTNASEISAIFAPGGAVDWVMVERGQVTIFSPDGRGSLVRELADAATWTTALADINQGILRFKSTLPASFTAGDRVLVEATEDRYTWMLTVRRKEPSSLIDVVVFFRRAFGRLDERVYLVSLNAGTAAEAARKGEQKEFYVAWNASTGDPKPNVGAGDWMFDPENFRWHKIGRVNEEEPFTLPVPPQRLGLPTGYTTTHRIVFRLEGTTAPGETIRRGIFMRGIVDVFPIMPKSAGN